MNTLPPVAEMERAYLSRDAGVYYRPRSEFFNAMPDRACIGSVFAPTFGYDRSATPTTYRRQVQDPALKHRLCLSQNHT
ncbi:MAG: hypothetical protein HY000_33050 [Planctomycetes bacterium]|nr:hypothetical protein [Planctomycetota bacterium]